ncbi:MAG: hypothetical protein ABIQ95_13175 [Bdellovibrionia bacterium]
MRFMRFVAVSTFISISVFAGAALANDDSANNLSPREPKNVLEEGRTYLAQSSEERGYALAFESSEYRTSLKQIENDRALDLCHEAGFESLAAEPKTAKVKSPEPTEAWTIEDGQLVQGSYENVRPWLFTNDGCKNYTPKKAARISSIGFMVGTVVSFATIPVMGPAGILTGVTCFGAAFLLNSNAYTIDGKNLLPIRASKALQRYENEKVVRLHPLPLPTKWVVKHKIFTEVLCK